MHVVRLLLTFSYTAQMRGRQVSDYCEKSGFIKTMPNNLESGKRPGKQMEYVCPRTRPCACGKSASAATTVPHLRCVIGWYAVSTTGQNRPQSTLLEAGRKTHVPVSAASPPKSLPDRPANRPRAPLPSRISPSTPHGINETQLRQRAV